MGWLAGLVAPQGSRVLWHHNAAVTGLSFEDPWLASSSADGCIILQASDPGPGREGGRASRLVGKSGAGSSRTSPCGVRGGGRFQAGDKSRSGKIAMAEKKRHLVP